LSGAFVRPTSTSVAWSNQPASRRRFDTVACPLEFGQTWTQARQRMTGAPDPLVSPMFRCSSWPDGAALEANDRM
jgi:hypothetical protein